MLAERKPDTQGPVEQMLQVSNDGVWPPGSLTEDGKIAKSDQKCQNTGEIHCLCPSCE